MRGEWGRLVCMKKSPVPAEISPSALLSPLKGSKSICSTCLEPKVSGKVVKGQERLGKSCPGAGDCLGFHCSYLLQTK